jgi:hypothetical protein
MVLAGMDGDKGCGVADPAATPLRSGLNASHICGCINAPIAKSCGLMPRQPTSIIREDPPLCEARAHNIFASCRPGACVPWACKKTTTTAEEAEAAAAAAAAAGSLPAAPPHPPSRSKQTVEVAATAAGVAAPPPRPNGPTFPAMEAFDKVVTDFMVEKVRG